MTTRELWTIAAVAVGVYLIARRANAGAGLPPAALPEGGYTRVPDAFFRAEHAGSDLYHATGSVLPSGSVRDLIR